jgi:SAM-dependent methyltransferase
MINQSATRTESPTDLQKIYWARFAGQQAYRTKVWQVLTRSFFSRWVRPADTVLDLGCGYGEFSNNIVAGKKFAMDLNPSAESFLHSDSELLQQDCSQPWPIPDHSLDVVFTSNFLEHLREKPALEATVGEAFRCLKPGGMFIALGPNIKFLADKYWDFFDHYIALTELSLAEALTMIGFHVEEKIPKFLPYTMSRGFKPPVWMLRLYLKVPFLWKISGRQFLVIARKP